MTDSSNRFAALIDMDGVLYDSMKYHSLAWQRLISELGIPCTRDEFYLYEGMTGEATINLIFNRYYGKPCEPQRIKELYALKTRYFVEIGQKEPMPGADRMLNVLRDADWTRVLVTGSAQSSLINHLEIDYPGHFPNDKRVTALDVKHGKPDPEPYLHGLNKAGVDAAHAIVIENAPLGVRAGKAAGCFTIAVTTGPIPKEAFVEEKADLIFPSMPALADAMPEILASRCASLLKPL